MGLLRSIKSRCWAYDVAGVMVDLYWDDATGQGISIRIVDEENDEILRRLAEKIANN